MPLPEPGVPLPEPGVRVGVGVGVGVGVAAVDTIRLTAPVVVSSSTSRCCGWAKSSMPRIDPARASNDWSPMRPVDQLSSMNFVVEVCSIAVWSTSFCLANGEMTR